MDLPGDVDPPEDDPLAGGVAESEEPASERVAGDITEDAGPDTEPDTEPDTGEDIEAYASGPLDLDDD